METNWVKMRVDTKGVSADEVAGVLADGFLTAVEVTSDNTLCIWFSEENSGPEVENSITQMIKETFPTALPTIFCETEKKHDWQEKWKEFLEPVEVGDSIVITPSWKADLVSVDKKAVVVIDPGMAFGTGNHATTEACALLLERYLGKRVLDIGTGTGVLAILSALLGAQKVVAIDNDPVAVSVALGNVEQNGVAGSVEVLEGEIDIIHEKFDMVVANLFMGPLLAIAPAVKHIVVFGGVFVLSGLKVDQEKVVGSAVRHEDFTLIDRVEKDGWVALAYRLGIL